MNDLNPKKTWPVFMVFAMIVIGIVGYYLYKYYQDASKSTTSSDSSFSQATISPTPKIKSDFVVYSVKRDMENKSHDVKGYIFNKVTNKIEEIASWNFKDFDFHSMLYEEAYVNNPIQTSPNLDFAVYIRTKQLPGMDAGEGPTQLVKYDFKSKKDEVLLSIDNYFTQWLLSADGKNIVYHYSYAVSNNPNESESDLVKLDISSKDKKTIASKIGKYINNSDMAWYPDNNTISWAYKDENNDFFRYSVNVNTQKTELIPWYNYKQPDYSSTFPPMLTISMISPDRQKVVFDEHQADNTWKIKMVKIADKEFSDIYQTPSNYAPRAETRWSPDNIHVAWDFTPIGQGDMSNYPGQLWLINTNNKKAEKIAEHKMIPLHEWNNDGKYIYYVAKDDKIDSLYQYTVSNKQNNKLIELGENDIVLNIIK